MLHGKLVFPWCPWQMEQFWPENKQIIYFQIFLQHRTLVPLMGSNILTINYSVLGARELLAVPFQFSFFWNLPHQVKDRNVRKNIHCLIRLFEKGAIQIWSPHCETLYWGSTDKLCKWDSDKGEGGPDKPKILWMSYVNGFKCQKGKPSMLTTCRQSKTLSSAFMGIWYKVIPVIWEKYCCPK